MTRRRVSLVIVGAAVLAWAAFHVTMRGIVFRSPRADAVAAEYAADLAHTRPTAAGVVVSPSGRFAAFNTRAARSYHTINVWDAWSEEVIPILSIQEIDPGSGVSHDLAWSADSRALLISGSGKVPFGRSGKLCFVYLPEHAVLHEVAPCR